MYVLGKDIQPGEHRSGINGEVVKGMDSYGDGNINSVPSAPKAWRMEEWETR